MPWALFMNLFEANSWTHKMIFYFISVQHYFCNSWAGYKAFCLNQQFGFSARWDQIHVWRDWKPNFMELKQINFDVLLCQSNRQENVHFAPNVGHSNISNICLNKPENLRPSLMLRPPEIQNFVKISAKKKLNVQVVHVLSDHF